MHAGQTNGDDEYDVAIVEAVAEQEGVEPEELHPPLHDVVDSDALNAVLSSGAENARVVFAYLGYEVTVSADGNVSVAPLD